jgi:ferritin-like metal-binding protein YciE
MERTSKEDAGRNGYCFLKEIPAPMEKGPKYKPDKKENKKALLRLFQSELQQILWVEKRLSGFLPGLMAGAMNDELRIFIEDYLVETELQKEKIEEVFRMLQRRKIAVKSPGMSGILKETEALLDEIPGDASMCTCLRKVVHYEIAVYSHLQVMAMRFEMKDVVPVISRILSEVKEVEKRLGKLSVRIFKI